MPPATSVLDGSNLPCPICRQITQVVFLGAQSLPGFLIFCVFSSVQFPFSIIFFPLFFFLHNSLFLSSLGNLPGTPQSFHTLVI